MLNIVNLLIQIGSIIGLVGLIITFVRVVSHKHNFLIKFINILLIVLCVAIIIASGYSLLAGTVSISTDPTGADVYFDDTYIDASPVVIQNVMAGTHSIRVVKEGYETTYQMLHVDVQETVSKEIVMKKQTGTLQLTANVDGAAVYADKTLVGYTPLSAPLTLGAGTHEILVSKENYYDVRTTVEIEPGKTETCAVKLSPVISSVQITSEPAGALVSIDGEPAGVTPLSVEKLTLGQHVIEVSLDGYEKKTDFISVVNQQGISRSYVLTPTLGSISVITEPEGLEVFLDGVLAGTAPLTIENLVPDKYTVSVNSAQYSDNPTLNAILAKVSGTSGIYEKTVLVEAGKTTEVRLGAA
ncbi:MAG TPA: PEGA domain-containing protein [Methanocorpusculum sp.]|nr:PEGA domain-containing protein [Methanocorpusculum sp.]